MENELEAKYQKEKPSYESNHDLKKLLFLVVVVNDGQSSAIIKGLYEDDASLAFVVHGKGTSTSDFYDVLGMGVEKKEIIISIINDDQWPDIRAKLDERFKLSQAAKGIAYTVEVDSVAGVSIYKMLSNTREVDSNNPITKRLWRHKKHGK